MLAPLQSRVRRSTCHPKQDIMAAGYSDGTILIVRFEDGRKFWCPQWREPVSRWPCTPRARCCFRYRGRRRRMLDSSVRTGLGPRGTCALPAVKATTFCG